MNDIAPALPMNDTISSTTMSFEEIYRMHGDFVYTIAYGVVVNRDDASEVTQEVFVKVYKSLARFRADADIKTWLYRIAVNESLNYLKRNRSRKRVQVDLEQVDGEQAAPHGPSHEAGQMTVDAMLQSLAPEYRACLTLRTVHGLSYQEIAQTLHVNINTIRTRLRRAREQVLRAITGGGSQ